MTLKLDAQAENAMTGKKILLAFSGGADSVALLLLLEKMRADGLISLCAAHFNHMIRPEADADEEFCRRLCEQLNVEFFCGRADVPVLAKNSHAGLESAARDARYAFLYKLRTQVGADYIALAHHADDQAETVLMHLMRGSGARGLGGMRSVNGALIRPLLNIRKHQLEEFLRASGHAWREDATNRIADTPRNALRILLNQSEAFYPGYAQAIGRAAAIARQDDDLLCAMAAEYSEKNLEKGPFGYFLPTDTQIHPAVLSRVIKKILGRDADFDQVQAAAAFMDKTRAKMQTGPDRYIEKTPAGLYFAQVFRQKSRQAKFSFSGETRLEGVGSLFARACPPEIIYENGLSQVLDADALADCVLRTRQDGDFIHPLGLSGKKLLSDYFTDKKLDHPRRDYTLLLARDQEILWAVGLGISKNAAITNETRRAVHVRAEYTTIAEGEDFYAQ